ncbi:MAG: hypothetical protein Q7S25_04645 [Candidatus Limnocylindria bacterium]|nr:hypothetical protein [Candidatus Limnocylindria bacterium]
MRRDGGQALVVAVLLVALAAMALAGLRGAQETILERARDQRAGEAAVEAAGAVVADALAAAGEVVTVVNDPRVQARARTAADEIAAENGRARPEGLRLAAVPAGIEVTLALGGQAHRAAVSLSGIRCCPR